MDTVGKPFSKLFQMTVCLGQISYKGDICKFKLLPHVYHTSGSPELAHELVCLLMWLVAMQLLTTEQV